MVHFYFASVQPITSFIIHVIHYLASSHNPRSQNKRSICIGCHLNNSNFYLNPTELYWKTSISVATLIKTKGTSGSSSSCCLWMIWVYKLTVTFAIFIQHAVIYFSKNSAKKKKKINRKVFYLHITNSVKSAKIRRQFNLLTVYLHCYNWPFIPS